MLGVIPTLGIYSPLAILAILFPTIFGGVVVVFRQWFAFITVLSINSTLYLLYRWLGASLGKSWWGTDAGLWFVMTIIALLGTLWAWSRQIYTLSVGGSAVPCSRKTETIVLLALTTLCGGGAAFLILFSAHLDLGDYLVFVFAFGIAAATAVRIARAGYCGPSTNPGRSTEGVILSAVLLAHVGVTPQLWHSGGDVAGAAEVFPASGARVAQWVGAGWHFKTSDARLFASSPLIDGDRIYAAAAASPVFEEGTLYCLDRGSGKKLWEFNGDGELKNMISSPCVADGRLFIGEGFHDSPNCKIWCVDSATGTLAWHFQTQGQTESSPAVAAGKVYFGAGNDGLYCVDANVGKELWRFPGPNHHGRLLRFGAGPAIVGDRLYAATGVDRNKVGTDSGETALFCLDAHSGNLIWKVALKLPAWGAPVVFKGQIFLGIGNGDMLEDAQHDQPLGTLLCFDAGSGREIWHYSLANGVLDRPAVDDTSVTVGCRDGKVYSLDRRKGTKRWETSLDSPIVAAPALAQWCGKTDSVVAVATGGKVCCLDPNTGAIQWTYNLTHQNPYLSAAPKIVVSRTSEGDRRQIYFGGAVNLVGTGVGRIITGQGVVYCLEDKLKDH